jgi:hypothetical protein
MSMEKPRCNEIALLTGEQCKAPHYREGMCYSHFTKAKGWKRLHEYRDYERPVAEGKKLLRKFGLQYQQVQSLRKAFPEIDKVFESTDVTKTLHLMHNILAFKQLADASPDEMKALLVLSKHLTSKTEDTEDETSVDLNLWEE